MNVNTTHTHARTHARTHAPIRIHLRTYTHTHTHARTHTHTPMRTHAHAHAHAQTRTRAHAHAHACANTPNGARPNTSTNGARAVNLVVWPIMPQLHFPDGIFFLNYFFLDIHLLWGQFIWAVRFPGLLHASFSKYWRVSYIEKRRFTTCRDFFCMAITWSVQDIGAYSLHSSICVAL